MAKGAVRDKSTNYDIVFTGPKMKIVYSGCNWNTIVFSMDNNQVEFENWLYMVWEEFQQVVSSDPAKFKVVGRRGPGFPKFIVTPSKDPEMYPNELRCRLATRPGDSESVTAVIQTEDGNLFGPVANIRGGGYMTPIFRLGYYKIGDDFGLNLTVLKGEYNPPVVQTGTENEDWMMDTEANVSGSGMGLLASSG